MGRTNPTPVEGSITGADFLQLTIDDAPPGGRAAWLAAQLRNAIADGRLIAGHRLPATRALAADLRVSRGVVTEAYRRLVEDGQVDGRGRGGTVVVGGATGSAAGASPGSVMVPPRTGLAELGSLFTGEPDLGVFDTLRAAAGPIDLSPGVPDLAAFPRAAWLRAERAVLSDLSPSAFGYGDPAGAPVFRQAVAGWLARYRGIRADPAQLVVVAGVAQALALLALVLQRTGLRSIAVEDPGSFGARRHLEQWGLATVAVPVDESGLRVSELRGCAAEAVVVTPAHQFPTGVVLDGGRRRELADWVAEGGLVIEDDYDAEHRYDRPPVPALRATIGDRICYTGSVSKILAPALRVGWLLAPPRLVPDLVAAKRDMDLGNPVLAQLVLAALMDSGELERQLRLVRRRHRRRRDVMIAAIARELPGARVHGAAAGLHLMVTFERKSLGSGFTDVELAAAALQRGVKVHPLSWHRDRPGDPGLVLGYAAAAPGEIGDGIATLGDLTRRRGRG